MSSLSYISSNYISYYKTNKHFMRCSYILIFRYMYFYQKEKRSPLNLTFVIVVFKMFRSYLNTDKLISYNPQQTNTVGHIFLFQTLEWMRSLVWWKQNHYNRGKFRFVREVLFWGLFESNLLQEVSFWVFVVLYIWVTVLYFKEEI